MPFEEFFSWHIVKGLVQWIADVWYEEFVITTMAVTIEMNISPT